MPETIRIAADYVPESITYKSRRNKIGEPIKSSSKKGSPSKKSPKTKNVNKSTKK